MSGRCYGSWNQIKGGQVMIKFLLGFILGGIIGMLIMGLIIAGKEDER